KVGLLPPVMWLSVGSASSLFVPTLTSLSALPWLPVTGALGAVLDLPEMRASAVLGSSQPRLGSERDEAVLRPCMPAEDSSCWISGATRCEYRTSEARK